MAGLLIVPGLWPVFDVNGNPVAGATINFYSPGTVTPKAVYSDNTLGTSLGAVLTTNAGGEPTTLAGSVARLWWAPNGQAYDIQVTAGASTRTWSDVIISEPSFVNTFSASYWGASPSASATTNRNALQAAVDYVSSLGGGTIDIDVPGYYNIAKRTAAPIDRALNVPKGVNIRGLGTGAPQDSGVALVTLQPSEDMTLFIAGNTMVTQTCTISNASPGVITATAHGKVAGDVVYFATTGGLPAPLLPMFPYYVLATGLTADSFRIGLSGSTPAINTTTAGSGVHTLISATSLTHSFGMSDINIYGSTPNVQVLIAESTVGAEWDNVLVEPGNPAAQRHGWLHASNFLAAWLNQYTRLQVGGFTSGVGAAHYGSDSSYSQCLFSGSGVNFRMSEGSISIDGGQCENGNNGGGIGTGRGFEIVPSNTGRNVALSIRSRFVANNGDIYIYDSPTGSGFNGRILIDSTHHDCRATNISVGVNFNNVTIKGTFNEQNPAGTPHITWRGASTGNVIMGNFSEGPTTRFSNLPADALVLSGGNGQLSNLENLSLFDTGLSGATFTPNFQNNTNESFSAGSGFYIQTALVNTKVGGTGNRETLHVEAVATSNAAGLFVVGIQSVAHGMGTASGSYFGLSGIGWVDSTVLATAECSGAEFNTKVENAAVVRKTGAQIVDVAGSVGAGSVYDAGLLVLKQATAVGYKNAFQVGSATDATLNPIGATGKMFVGYGSFADGVDFSAATISGAAFRSPNFIVEGDGDAGVGAILSSGAGVSTGDVIFEHGKSRSASGNVFIDMHAQIGVDYNTRIIRFSGANGNFIALNTGTGNFDLQTGAGAMRFLTSDLERMRITSTGNVGIGVTPDASALLDVSSTTQGFLPPRMTTAQRDLIASPVNGLVLYNSTTNKLQVRAAGSWVDLH